MSTGLLATILATCVVVFTTMIIILRLVKGKAKAQAEQATDLYEDVEHYLSHAVIDTEMNSAYSNVYSTK